MRLSLHHRPRSALLTAFVLGWAALAAISAAALVGVPASALAQDGETTTQDSRTTTQDGETTVQDYETTPREEPEQTQAPRDESPEHSEGSTGDFPVATVVIVVVAGLVLTVLVMWLRRRW